MDKATPTPSTAPTEKIWECKIGGISDTPTPSWSDGPMRQAVEAAFEKVTGKTPAFLFSGWGASLTEPERAVVENRLPNRAEVERLAAQAAPSSAIIASLGGDVEPIVWQFRWTNPNNEPHQPPEMTAWEVVEPKYRLQSVEQRLNELRSATYNGKACYEVRALIDASTVAAIKAERDAALARVAELEAAALEGARRIESLKRECSDPESPIAIQNARYMNVSYFLRSALTKGQPAPQPQQEQP